MAGLYWPMSTAIIGAIYLIARIAFAYGYARNGPEGRMIGAPIQMIIQIIMPIYTMVAMALMGLELDESKIVGKK